MQELEKILEEIKSAAVYAETKGGYGAMSVSVGMIERIIHKHMPGKDTDASAKCGDCSRRKWYQKGLEDGSKYNGGWFSVEKILPERIGKWQGDCYEVTIILNGRYLVTTAAYDHAEKKWLTKSKVIAWRPLPEPYRPERSRE